MPSDELPKPSKTDISSAPKIEDMRDAASSRLSEMRSEAYVNRADFGFRELKANLEASKRAETIAQLKSKRDTLIKDFLNHPTFVEDLNQALTNSQEPEGPKEVEGHVRTYGRGTLLLLDIDHFKDVNAIYGYLNANAAISALGDLIKGKLHRANDTSLQLNSEPPAEGAKTEEDSAARLGGDEIVAFLNKDPISGGERVAETIRLEASKVARQALAEATGLPIEQIRPVTVSIGVAEAAPGDDATELIRKANVAQAAAKRAGRNRVQLYGPELDQIEENEEAKMEYLRGVVEDLINRNHFTPQELSANLSSILADIEEKQQP